MGTLRTNMKIIKIVKRLIWLKLFGGSSIENSFKFLSQSILENKKEINELKRTISALELRVWELEDHTPEEHITKVGTAINEFRNRAEQIEKSWEKKLIEH